MNLLLWGLTLGTVGKLILGIAVLRVHAGILKEHGIDGAVIKSLKRERILTLLGLTLIVIGYLCEVFFYGFSTNFFECIGRGCAAAVQSSFSQ